MGRLSGAILGTLFFVWIAGTRGLDPGEIGWLMRYDWPVHFFGWHFFRSEPWHWPPGLIESYYAPLGTSIGFTDSVPLVAFALKPISAWLPPTFQYIGAWLLLCFALQGAFGAWLIAQWTPRLSLQAAGAFLFVLMPILLVRIGHPALCAHWLLLWALVIASRTDARRFRAWEWGLIGVIAGLVHPYLAVMVLVILAGITLTPSVHPLPRRATAAGAAVATTVTAWWAAGFLSVSGAESLATEGLGYYSMNLLAPITPTGWSAFLPDLPRATSGQDYEGFQYLGLGVLVLIALAAVVSLSPRARSRRTGTDAGAEAPALRAPEHSGTPSTQGTWAPGHPGTWAPGHLGTLLACLLMATYALSPRITFGSRELVDLTGSWSEPMAVFRSTGRFFWPMAYLLLAWALATTIRRWPSRVALAIVLPVVTLQLLDLHAAHEDRRRTSHDPAFFAWTNPMTSPVWGSVLPLYDHLVLYPPPQCGASPIPFEPAAYLAGLHGLTINTGGVARPDEAARLRYCHDLGEKMKAGVIDDRSFYIMQASEVAALRRDARPPAVCGAIDGISVCVTAASYQRWRDVAELR
jgi:hypothetical protein